MLKVLASSLVCLSLLAGCASTPASPEPSYLAATPGSTGRPTASPSLPPLPASASLPVRGSAREIGERVLLAPAPSGDLFVSIPRPAGSVLALLDNSGVPRPGWPIVLTNATVCGQPLPVEDGSVRIICNGTDLPQFDNDVSDVRAFAFDAGGRLMAGWPVELRPGTEAVIGDELVSVEQQILTDTYNADTVSHEVWVTRIADDGTIRSGARAPMVGDGGRWALGPDGTAYGVSHQVGDSASAPKTSTLIALTSSGASALFRVALDGIASGPAFDAAGNIILTVSSFPRSTSRIDVVDPSGVRKSSAELAIATGVVAYSDGPYEGGAPIPRPALIARDGMIVVFSEIDDPVFALDASLQVTAGWPHEPHTPLERREPPLSLDGIDSSSLAVPAMDRDSGTLYMPLQARTATVGGNLVAVGPDGRVRPGWPVELKRAGSEFWSVVVGSNGTVYALAIEPEAGGASSATILAIAPDSTVRWTTTIIEP